MPHRASTAAAGPLATMFYLVLPTAYSPVVAMPDGAWWGLMAVGIAGVVTQTGNALVAIYERFRKVDTESAAGRLRECKEATAKLEDRIKELEEWRASDRAGLAAATERQSALRRELDAAYEQNAKSREEVHRLRNDLAALQGKVFDLTEQLRLLSTRSVENTAKLIEHVVHPPAGPVEVQVNPGGPPVPVREVDGGRPG